MEDSKAYILLDAPPHRPVCEDLWTLAFPWDRRVFPNCLMLANKRVVESGNFFELLEKESARVLACRVRQRVPSHRRGLPYVVRSPILYLLLDYLFKGYSTCIYIPSVRRWSS